MTNEEAKHKLDFMKKAYQKLIDEKVDRGKLVGDGVRGEWQAKTPLNEAYKDMIEGLNLAIKALEQPPSREWKEIYAESEGSNSWIEFKCPHCGYSFGMESGEYGWHYGDEIPWKYCPICGGSAEHKPYKAESEDTE